MKVESTYRQDWKVGAAVVANQDLCQRGQGRKSREEKPKMCEYFPNIWGEICRHGFSVFALQFFSH